MWCMDLDEGDIVQATDDLESPEEHAVRVLIPEGVFGVFYGSPPDAMLEHARTAHGKDGDDWFETFVFASGDAEPLNDKAEEDLELMDELHLSFDEESPVERASLDGAPQHVRELAALARQRDDS